MANGLADYMACHFLLFALHSAFFFSLNGTARAFETFNVVR